MKDDVKFYSALVVGLIVGAVAIGGLIGITYRVALWVAG